MYGKYCIKFSRNKVIYTRNIQDTNVGIYKCIDLFNPIELIIDKVNKTKNTSLSDEYINIMKEMFCEHLRICNIYKKYKRDKLFNLIFIDNCTKIIPKIKIKKLVPNCLSFFSKNTIKKVIENMVIFLKNEKNMCDDKKIKMLLKFYAISNDKNVLSVITHIICNYGPCIGDWYNIILGLVRYPCDTNIVENYYNYFLKKINIKFLNFVDTDYYYYTKNFEIPKYKDNNEKYDIGESFRKGGYFIPEDRTGGQVFSIIRKLEINKITRIEQWIESISYNYYILESLIIKNRSIITKKIIINFVNNWNNKYFLLRHKNIMDDKNNEFSYFNKCLKLLLDNYNGYNIDVISIVSENCNVSFFEIYLEKLHRKNCDTKIIFDISLKLFFKDKINYVTLAMKYLLNWNSFYGEILKSLLNYDINNDYILKERFKKSVHVDILIENLKINIYKHRNIVKINKIINFIISIDYEIDKHIFDIVKDKYNNHTSTRKNKNILDDFSKLIKY